MIKDYHIILASNSPRRKELLKGLDIDFEVCVIPDIDESYPSYLKPEEIPCYIAEKKANAYCNKISDNDVIITADTIVVFKEEVIEKPTNRKDAIKMLKKLSGQTHDVITGVVIATCYKRRVFSVSSAVVFTELDNEDICYYVDKYCPYDKAGAYGIQEWIGYVGVESIRGSFYNVMGLPVQHLYRELKRF